ncbi:MAG: nickel-responsive transcriptional regulator NikR [Candidatus Thermoplasmatota archaeon]
MTIVSLSINDKLLEKFDVMLSKKGFSTRSECFRDIIRRFVDECELETAEGQNLAVITLIYDKKKQPTDLIAVRHRFQEVQTMLHSHLDETNCLEVYIARGESSSIKKFVQTVRKIKAVKHVEFFSTTSDV